MNAAAWMRMAGLGALAALGLIAVDANAGSRPHGFGVAPRGCAMAHCEPTMADRALAPAPRRVASQWHDATTASNDQGLGCSGNTAVALCTFGNRAGDRLMPYMKAYDARGRVLWDSGDALNSWAWTSVPLVGRNGGAIMADDTEIVRFSAEGDVLWRTPTPGGRPISPTRTENGTIVLATRFGPLSAYDPRTGRRIATLRLDAELDGLQGFFDTTNTPGARGNRIYVSTEFTLDGSLLPDPNRHARLYAIDVDPAKPAGKRLRVAWHHDFGARSGASPTVKGRTVIFDGDREAADAPLSPRFIAVRDMGDRPKVIWQRPLEGPGVASAALDPRGGAWVFAFAKRSLWRLSTNNGAILQTLDLDALVDEPDVHVPLSALTIAEGPNGRPVMLLTARSASSALVVAIDVERERLIWKHRLPEPVRTSTPMGQFPVLERRNGEAAVVFTALSGVRGVRGPATPRGDR